VHGSLARAIQPFHALVDGDVLYTVTTAEVDNEDLPSMSLGVVSSELAWDAVLSCFDDES
jgi:L-aminopeptidase/D-esterase-like protein